MPGETANLSLPFIFASQAEKHATLNESLIALDQLVQARVLSRSLMTEPPMPVEGQSWILPATSSGPHWQGFGANVLASFVEGAWRCVSPKVGWRVWVIDEKRLVVWSGLQWEYVNQDRVAKSGDSMSGPLGLPSAGLQVGEKDLHITTTGAGIGTSTPLRRLHVVQSQCPEFVIQETSAVPDTRNFRQYFTNSQLVFGSLNDAGTMGMNLVVLDANTKAVLPGADNAQQLGAAQSRWSTIFSVTGVISTSDARLKTDKRDCPLGLEFICRLRPVGYRWQNGGQKIEAGPIDDGTDCTRGTHVPGKRTHIGFLAQDVRSVILSDMDWAAWSLSDPMDPQSQQGLRYDQFIGPLVLAIQELSQRVSHLESTIGQRPGQVT